MAKKIEEQEEVKFSTPNFEARMKELEEKLAVVLANNESLKAQKKEEPFQKANFGNMVLVCNAKVRTFTVRPEEVIKIYKGTQEGIILKDRVLTITPGSVLEVTASLAEFLLSFNKDFSRYDVPLS